MTDFSISLTKRQCVIVDFALQRLVEAAYYNANHAAQDKQEIHYKASSVTKFLDDAKTAESVRAILREIEELIT